MAVEYYFAAKSIGLSKLGGRKPCSLLDAARHNKREIQAERGVGSRIDHRHVVDNEMLSGPATATEVVATANKVMVAAGIDVSNLRRDHCQGVELVFSIPVAAHIDAGPYFRRCLDWVGQALPGVPVLSADVHRDEGEPVLPHMHVLLAPVRDGQMVGSALIGRAELAKLRESFWRKVAEPAGLRRGIGRLVGQSKALAVAAVLDHMERTKAPELRGALWPLTRKQIESEPLPYLLALGIDPQKLKAKPIGIGSSSPDQKPIGIARPTAKVDGENQTLSCVGIASPLPSPNHQKQTPETAAEHITQTTVGGVNDDDSGVIRERDDLPAGYWCEELGQHIKPPPTGPSPAKLAINAAVLSGLKALKSRKVAGCV